MEYPWKMWLRSTHHARTTHARRTQAWLLAHARMSEIKVEQPCRPPNRVLGASQGLKRVNVFSGKSLQQATVVPCAMACVCLFKLGMAGLRCAAPVRIRHARQDRAYWTSAIHSGRLSTVVAIAIRRSELGLSLSRCSFHGHGNTVCRRGEAVQRVAPDHRSKLLFKTHVNWDIFSSSRSCAICICRNMARQQLLLGRYCRAKPAFCTSNCGPRNQKRSSPPGRC